MSRQHSDLRTNSLRVLALSFLLSTTPHIVNADKFVGNIGDPWRLLKVPECCRLCPQGFEPGRLQPVNPSTKAYDGLPQTASVFLSLQARGIYDSKIASATKAEMCYRKGSDQSRLAEMHNLLPCCPVCTQQFVPMPFEFQWQSPNAFYTSNLFEMASSESTTPQFVPSGIHRKKGFGPAQPINSFVETSFNRFRTDTSKGGCCTVCDKDDETQYPKTIGEKAYHPKMYPAFLQVNDNGQMHKSAKTGYSILDDGCCNTCSGDDLEPPEQRYSEPHGGPFGLLPRLEGIHVEGMVKPLFGSAELGFDLTGLCRKAYLDGHGVVDKDMEHARPMRTGLGDLGGH